MIDDCTVECELTLTFKTLILVLVCVNRTFLLVYVVGLNISGLRLY